jgi:hypothetical protein
MTTLAQYEQASKAAAAAMEQLITAAAGHSPGGVVAAHGAVQAVRAWLEQMQASTLHASTWAIKLERQEGPEWEVWSQLHQAPAACAEALMKEPAC